MAALGRSRCGSVIPGWAVLALAALLIVVAGCGWRLRGATAVELALPPMFVEITDAAGALRREMERGLKTAGVAVVAERELASLILLVGPENTQRRVLSVGAGGKAREYELQYSLRFAVNRPDGVAVLPGQTISLQRDYAFDEEQVLASDREQRRLFDQMRLNAVHNVLQRLSGARDKLAAEPAQEPETNAN